MPLLSTAAVSGSGGARPAGGGGKNVEMKRYRGPVPTIHMQRRELNSGGYPMPRGRKPKPTVLKLLTGNPGKRRLPTNEPIPLGALTAPPPWFDAEHRATWRHAVENAPAGVLRRIDRGVLVIWTAAAVLHARASDEFNKTAETALLTIINTQARTMLIAASALGFTPKSRVAIA